MNVAEAKQIRFVERVGADHDAAAAVRAGYKTGVLAGAFQPRPRGPDLKASAYLLTFDRAAPPVAFVTFYEVNDHRIWVDLLWVDIVWRRRGHGRSLLDRVEKFADEEGMKSVLLGHVQSNAAMSALCDRMRWPVDHIVRSRPLGRGKGDAA